MTIPVVQEASQFERNKFAQQVALNWALLYAYNLSSMSCMLKNSNVHGKHWAALPPCAFVLTINHLDRLFEFCLLLQRQHMQLLLQC